TPGERERVVDRERERYGAALRRIAAAGDAPLSADDQRIKDLWGAEGTPSRLHAATEDVRFQLGQADRFRAGLIRSGAWETHIAQLLRLVPRCSRGRPHPREILRLAAEAERGQVPGGAVAGLRLHADTRARAQDRAGEAACAQPGPDPRGVGRAAARAEGLPVATAARRNVLDAGAPGTTPQPRRDVRRTERPAPISGAGRRYARPGRRALRSVGRYARTDESPAGERALARRPDDRRARSGRGHGRIDRGT